MSKVNLGTIVFLGIGSNMGEPVQRCLDAINRISLLDQVKVLNRSSLYKTEPVGFKDQSWFINCVVEIRTVLTPYALLKAMERIENEMGRERKDKWGPRIIDIDVLLYGQDVIRENELIVPHPELHKRRFVLVPMNEIAPYVIHPSFGVSMKGLMSRLEDMSEVALIEDGINH